MTMTMELRTRLALVLLWSFTISGCIGFLSPAYTWFVSLTPLNLALYILVILLTLEDISKRFFMAIAIPFAMGMLSEMLGVNYGLIFGEYSYGENMGWKVLGVPWMIGVNWAVLTYCTAVVAKRLTSSHLGSVVISSLLMVAIDLLMEVSAPRFDYWEFEGGIAPLQNYFGWFGVAFVAQYLFQSVYRLEKNVAAYHILAGITLFFSIFLLF